jgi:DNA-binding NarL/FixJ family response regulator
MSHRILSVDDNTIIRRSIRHCIEQNTDWEVCLQAVHHWHLPVENHQVRL